VVGAAQWEVDLEEEWVTGEEARRLVAAAARAVEGKAAPEALAEPAGPEVLEVVREARRQGEAHRPVERQARTRTTTIL